jgi:hypothetical protein
VRALKTAAPKTANLARREGLVADSRFLDEELDPAQKVVCEASSVVRVALSVGVELDVESQTQFCRLSPRNLLSTEDLSEDFTQLLVDLLTLGKEVL